MMHADCPMSGTSVARFKVDNRIWGLFKISQTEQTVPIHILDLIMSEYVVGKG